jgi:hypothetical protein
MANAMGRTSREQFGKFNMTKFPEQSVPHLWFEGASRFKGQGMREV